MAAVAAVVVVVLAVVGLIEVGVRVERRRLAAQLHPFYDPPQPLAPGKPGALIRVAALDAPAGVQAWRVLYHSTTYDNRDIAVSGLVVVPTRSPPPGGFPVLSVAHGTLGSARTCAPSLQPFQARSPMQPAFFATMVQPFTDAGYAVAATDYQGLGTPGIHPYLVGEDAARNVLDTARAIRALPDLALSDVTLIWGHSQGGQAAVFAGQIAPRYAPELRILGVVAGAPAAELSMIADEVAGLTKPSLLTGLVVMIARAWSATYPGLSPESVLTPAGIQDMHLVDRDCVGGVLLAYALRPASEYVRANTLERPPWPGLLVLNTPGAVHIPVPLLVFQGEADDLIRPQFTEAFVQRLCAARDTVVLKLYPGQGHLDVIAPSMPDTLAWMADRLAQRPAPSSCPEATARSASPVASVHQPAVTRR